MYNKTSDTLLDLNRVNLYFMMTQNPKASRVFATQSQEEAESFIFVWLANQLLGSICPRALSVIFLRGAGMGA